MIFQHTGTDWSLEQGGRLLLQSSQASPLLYVGCGEESVDMYRGNFRIDDYVTERRPVLATSVCETEQGAIIEYGEDLRVTLTLDGDCATLKFTQKNPAINRLWFRVTAEADECCWGCGEQMSYFNLRGRHYPLWTSEPGVGGLPVGTAGKVVSLLSSECSRFSIE